MKTIITFFILAASVAGICLAQTIPSGSNSTMGSGNAAVGMGNDENNTTSETNNVENAAM